MAISVGLESSAGQEFSYLPADSQSLESKGPARRLEPVSRSGGGGIPAIAVARNGCSDQVASKCASARCSDAMKLLSLWHKLTRNML